MLLGQYRHNVDEKNRMRVPAKMRSQLGDKYYVMKGTSGCLFVFGEVEMQNTLNEKLKSLPISDVKAQKSVRMLFSSAYEVEEDSQGRFVLPAYLKEFAKINKNVVSIGVGNRIEIWSEEEWDKYNQDVDFDTIMGDLNQYGI